jgi:hypothetical protein
MKRFIADHNRRTVGIAFYALAALALILAVVTSIAPTWLEDTLGMSPDGGSGETEWGIVAVLAVAAVVLAYAGRRVRTPAHSGA